jgi:hypothetical protein
MAFFFQCNSAVHAFQGTEPGHLPSYKDGRPATFKALTVRHHTGPKRNDPLEFGLLNARTGQQEMPEKQKAIRFGMAFS